MTDRAHLEGLNDDQRLAVAYRGGPLVVLAGPGTGKTRVITRRVAHLVVEDGVEPTRVLAATFTVKAAGELRDRLGDLVGEARAREVVAGTFHSVALRIVRRFGAYAGLSDNPKIIDSALRRRLIRELILRDRGVYAWAAAEGRASVAAAADAMIGALRERAVTVARARDFAAAWAESVRTNEAALPAVELEAQRERYRVFADHATVYGAYEAECARRGWIDFDGLLTAAIEILRGHAGPRAILRDELRHAVVDEFQDVNLAQIELLRALFPPESGPDLCVVGDDDQSIYAFRGADDLALARFDSIWNGAARIALSVNYRSSPRIIRLANEVITGASRRFDDTKVIEPAPGAAEGPVPECVEHKGESTPGEAVVALLLMDRASTAADGAGGRAWSDYAVVARTHLDLMRIQSVMALEGVPCIESRSASPAHDAGVRDVIAWIALLCEPDAVWAAQRLLARPPYCLSGETVGTWARAYIAWRDRRAIEGEGAGRGFIGWLATNVATPGGPADEDAAAAARLAGLHGRLCDVAVTEGAHAAVFEIVRATDAAHAEALRPIERVRRVEAIAALLEFVRAREDALDEPGDLAAFWSYYNDLDERERDLRHGGGDDIDGDRNGDAEDTDAVRLLTVFGAKGLEFDTVLVPRVCPPSGYPKINRDDESGPDVPEGLVDRLDDGRGVAQRRLDEERRMFYVAVTRAKRRLVLFTRKTKSRSKSTQFAQELTHDKAELGLVRQVGLSDVWSSLESAGLRLNSPAPPDAAYDAGAQDFAEDPVLVERSRLAAMNRVARAARAEAAAALDAAAGDDLTPADLERIGAMLRRSTLRLAAAAAVRKHGELPAWLAERAGEFAPELDRVTRAWADGEGSALRRVGSPLSLSYSKIDQYERCPRCFYLRTVVGIVEPEGPALGVGSVVHSALERYYRAWNAADADGRADRPDAAQLVEMARQEYLGRLRPGARPDAAAIERIAALALRAHSAFHDDSAHILHLEQTVRMPLLGAGGDDRADVLVAKIDRVDQAPDGRIRIIDYKSGEAWKKLLEPRPDDLQLGIYALAVGHLFGAAGDDAPVRGTAEYWLLATGERGVLDLEEIDAASVRERIANAAEGIMAQRFDPEPKCRTKLCSVFEF